MMALVSSTVFAQSNDSMADDELKRLEAAIDKHLESSLRPKKKYITAATAEPIYIDYMSRWVGKIERFANTNYADTIKKQNLSGSVVLSVGILRDGGVESVEIVESSGQKVLDDFVVQLATLAAPFEPLSNEMTGVDILYIARTWSF